MAEGLGVEEVRRIEQFEQLQELIDKVKIDLNKTMDKRKNDMDTALREIRKDMSKAPTGKNLNSTGKNSN